MIDEWTDFGPDGDWDWEPEDDAAWEEIPDWGDEPGWSDVDVGDLDEGSTSPLSTEHKNMLQYPPTAKKKG